MARRSSRRRRLASGPSVSGAGWSAMRAWCLPIHAAFDATNSRMARSETPGGAVTRTSPVGALTVIRRVRTRLRVTTYSGTGEDMVEIAYVGRARLDPTFRRPFAY